MKIYTKLLLSSCFLFLTNTAIALPILGQQYSVLSDVTGARFFKEDKSMVTTNDLNNSYYKFEQVGTGANAYIRFTLNLITEFGKASVSMYGSTADFFDGGDFTLKPSSTEKANAVINYLNAHPGEYDPAYDTNADGINSPLDALLYINDINSGTTSNSFKQIGLFTSNAAGFTDYSIISVMMNGVFHLDSSKFSIWNGQYGPGGVLLGKTDWWLKGGAPINAVPEPMTMGLLGIGLLGLRKKSKK